MRRFIILLAIMQLLLAVNAVEGAESFKRVQQWTHDAVFGRDFFTFIDNDNHMVGGFGQIGCRIITPDAIIEFAPRGQGPGDLMTFSAAFPYKGDIMVIEMAGKAKIFTKKNGTYAWKETKWFKTGKYAYNPTEGVFFDDKIFLTGEELLGLDGTAKNVAFLKVFDDNGKPLKSLIKKTYTESNRFYMMNHHVAGYKSGTIFFLPANSLTATEISSKNLEEVKEVALELPPFYKKMPLDFFAYRKYKNPQNLLVDLEKWNTTYSSITEVAVDEKFLVVQVRTCSDKLKKFALLFYNVENNFKLERTVFTDDFLLDVKDGKYYCFANGNPGRDEDTDKCVINIYAWTK